MKRFPLLVGFVSILIIIGGVFVFSKKSNTNNSAPVELPTSYEYYWGEGCPHCANVEDFLNSWENKDKVEIEKKEIYKDLDNQKLFKTRVEYCGLPNNQVGVPFLFTPKGECVIGDTPIISLFENLEFGE